MLGLAALSQYYLAPALIKAIIDQSYKVISTQEANAKPAGASRAHRPNTSQALFDASVSKHGTDYVIPQHINGGPPAEYG